MTVIESDVFRRWLSRLRDYRAVARISARLRQIAAFGHFGDTRAIGDVEELRIHYGPGYRIYFLRAVATTKWLATVAPDALERSAELPPIEEDGDAVVVLLCGGDKSTQKRDITRAKRLAEDWR